MGQVVTHALQSVSLPLPHGVSMYSPLLAFCRYANGAVWLAPYTGTTGLHLVQLRHCVSAYRLHGATWYVPWSSKAWHVEQGMHTLSENSVHGLFSHSPALHWVHGLQSLSTVRGSASDVRFAEHILRSTYMSAPEQFCMLVQFRHSDTSVLEVPGHVRFMYIPSGHDVAHDAHCVSLSRLHGDEMNLCGPQVSLHAAHVANPSIAQSLLTKLVPFTQLLGHVVHATVLLVPVPMHVAAPVASCFGGQSACVVQRAQPSSNVNPCAAHTGSLSVR